MTIDLRKLGRISGRIAVTLLAIVGASPLLVVAAVAFYLALGVGAVRMSLKYGYRRGVSAAYEVLNGG